MPTYPTPQRRASQGRGPWPRVIILVIILAFVVAMTRLGLSPDAAAGIGAATLAAACSAVAADGGLPDGEA